MMSLTRTLIRHAPTDYSSVFVRGLPASIDADEVRRYFCDKGYKCTVSFNKINNEYRKLYVALQFESERTARDVLNKYDNDQVLGYNVGLSYYKDKNRLYRDNGDSRVRRARVGQPIDKRRFNRTPSLSPSRSRRRRSRSRSRRSRSHSRHSDSDGSHRSRSRSHSGSSSPRRKNRSSSREKRKSRSRSFSRSPSRHSASPKRRHSRSPKGSDSFRHRRSESPSHRRHSSSRHSISPKRESSKHRSLSPEDRARSPYSPTQSPRKRTRSRSRSRSSSSERAKTPPVSSKRKLSLSPNRKAHSSPTHSTHSRDESPVKKSSRHSTDRTFPGDDQPSHHEKSKDEEDRHSSHMSPPSQKRKDPRRKSDASEGSALSSPEAQSDVPQKATSLSSSIYGKVASFTDMNVQQAPAKATSSSSQNSVVPNGNKRGSDDAEDVEADLRAEFLNNNDALYDSHERTQAPGFPLVSTSRNKAEKILDDLPIDPLSDGHKYVSRTVERDFNMSNGDKDGRNDGKKDDWTPEMISKLKVKKEEIVQAYKQDCDTFSTVVKMLISKDPDLEKRLQNALKENLKEIGQRCVEELNQLADTLKTESK
ncbi:uncharacterized protein [Amphiura filiformis]|uniref:uncharacterized protein n=1 Tax=Amphiura filiformis TaxID=82378 RepID=UPI003B21DCDF